MSDELADKRPDNESDLPDSGHGEPARINRGTFAKGGLAALAGLTNLLYPGVVGAATRVPSTARQTAPGLTEDVTADGRTIKTMVGPDPTFASGTVTAVTAAGVLVENPVRTRVIRIDPALQVWKEFFVSPDVIQVGDEVTAARGTPQADGSLVATNQWVWVNIGKREGFVQTVAADHLDYQPANAHVTPGQPAPTDTLQFSQALEVISGKDESAWPGGTSGLTSGTRFGSVGLNLPDGGFRATRIWVQIPDYS